MDSVDRKYQTYTETSQSKARHLHHEASGSPTSKQGDAQGTCSFMRATKALDMRTYKGDLGRCPSSAWLRSSAVREPFDYPGWRGASPHPPQFGGW